MEVKVYNVLLLNRNEPESEKILLKNHNGFRRKGSTTSKILTIYGIIEGVRAKNLVATLLFVDFSLVFDSIDRGKREQILLTFAISEETVTAIMILYKNTKLCPWCNGYRRRKWTRWHEFKSWTRLIAFHIALIPLGKVWIQLFSLQLWVNSRLDSSTLVRQLFLEKENSEFKPVKLRFKKLTLCHILPERRGWVNMIKTRNCSWCSARGYISPNICS